MKNTTVSELIKILKTMDPDAIICSHETVNDKSFFVTHKVCREFDNVIYHDDRGQKKNGNIVAIY